MANLKIYRDYFKLSFSILFFWIYIPHILAFFCLDSNNKKTIMGDLERLKGQTQLNLKGIILLLYFIHNNGYYRSLFYFRIGTIRATLIKWYRPGDKYFSIAQSCRIGKGMWFAHPYCTIINAERIGEDFSCLHLTTIGDSGGKRPRIGNNVKLGANVTIIGNVEIGDNVTIGAGSVVVKSIPSNCIAVGNPAKVVKSIS